MRILLVEDHKELAQLLTSGLTRDGYACDVAASLRQAQEALDVAPYSAMILDLGLPDGDGLDWLASKRRQSLPLPTLILTARNELDNMVAGLDAGADDYLVKPVMMRELSARLRAVLRRPGTRAARLLEVYPLTFDTNHRVARCHDKVIELSSKETTLLELLMRREGTVVTRDLIEHSLYNFDDPGSPNALEAIVSRLRRKL
ncbi:response regulator [Aquisediminimonas sediminicola]|uniref:response regulator n=1 Tax=Alteraquisediminimonas sediminicola TaxID=2676787 RepID=UPI001C8E10EF